MRGAAIAFLAAATPTLAARTVSLVGPSTGNLVYSTGSSATAVKFSAVGLTYTTSLTPGVSSAVKYSDGLGVNPSGDDRHTIDNSRAYDFILLRFNTAVALTGATFANANWYNDSRADTDATISFAAIGFDYAAINQTYTTTLSGTAKTNFFNAVGGSLNANQFVSNNVGWGTETRSFNNGPTLNVSKVWIVGASIANADRRLDSFKLQGVTFAMPTAAVVPEPSTWAMLILGFGLVGAAARRRRTTALA